MTSPPPPRTRLRVVPGPSRADVLVTTPLCASCPHGPAGCCAAPPRIALADLARIVHHGGREFLLEELEAGRLVRGSADASGANGTGARWLNYPRRPHASGVTACGYLGATGCVLPPERRSTTCNTYVCDEALARAEPGDTPDAVGRTRDELEATLARWDAELARALDTRWPEGHPLDAELLDALGAAWPALRP